MRDVTHPVRQIPTISHFLNFNRKRTCAVMSGFVRMKSPSRLITNDSYFPISSFKTPDTFQITRLFEECNLAFSRSSGKTSLFTKLSNTQAFVLSKHLQNQPLPIGQVYWSTYWSIYWSIYWSTYWVIFRTTQDAQRLICWLLVF